jgi:hypothetical protein
MPASKLNKDVSNLAIIIYTPKLFSKKITFIGKSQQKEEEKKTRRQKENNIQKHGQTYGAELESWREMVDKC